MKTGKFLKLQFLLFQLALILTFSPSQAETEAYEEIEKFSLDSIGDVRELIHKQSGAKLVLVQNEDQALGFTAHLRTPPYDNSGVFHVFEHVILDGSRLYPSKQIHSKLLLSSVASDIVATTDFVHTYYSFITQNSEDFKNLIFYHMDAILFPKAIEDPRIIKKEGWRYEIHPKTKKLSLNGVVLNEMKGFFSDIDNHFYKNIERFFLPDTPYAYDFGGDPTEIINLEFDQIVSTHKKYYHPQNMLISLYGDFDSQKILSEIDKNFLSHFEKSKNFKAPKIPLQKKRTYPHVGKASYPVQTKSNKNILIEDYTLDESARTINPIFSPGENIAVKGYVLGPLNPIENDALHIMLDTFLHETSSLKLRVSEDLHEDIEIIKFDAKDNLIAFVFYGMGDLEIDKFEFEHVLQKEIDKVIQNGLDSKLLNSILSQYDFIVRKKRNKSHKANYISEVIVYNWLYKDQSLKSALNLPDKLKKVHALVQDKEFVKGFFREHFKENKRNGWLVMEPDPNYFERFKQAEQKKMEEALKRKPLSAYKKEDEIYQKWLTAEEPPEIKDAVPLLELSDFTADKKPVPFRKHDKGPYEVIEYPLPSNGISYVQMFFDLQGVSEENLKNLTLFEHLLKRTDTKNHYFEELSGKIDKDIGFIDFQTSAYQSSKNPEEFKPFMEVKLSFLNENRAKSFALLKEIMLHSDFSPEDRVEHILAELEAEERHIDPDKASSLAEMAGRKTLFPKLEAFWYEKKGFNFTNYIMKSKIDSDELSSSLRLMLKNIFNQKRLHLITVISDEKKLESLKKSTESLYKSLPAQGSKDQNWFFKGQRNYSAYAIPSPVQYVTETASFREHGLKYSGALEVYSNYLITHFLNPVVRDKIGAYLTGSNVNQNGLWILKTEQDPNLKRTFEAFSKAVDFMKQEQKELTPEKLRPAITGALIEFYKDLSVHGKANQMTDLYLADSSWEDYMKIKEEILNTTPEDFKEITQGLEKAFKHSRKAVAGNKDKIKQSGCFNAFVHYPPK